MTISGALAFPFLLVVVILSLMGAVIADMPEVGAFIFSVIGGASYLLWRDAGVPGRPPWRRRCARALAAAGVLFMAGVVPFAFVERAAADFQRRHSAGGGVRPGLSLAEARATLARDADVTELALEGAPGVRFELEPKGLARWRFSFPLAELYYLDVRTDGDGRVASVKSWRD